MFDKTIKKAIKVFVALAMIVASGTALQKNVSAEGSNTANNMYVQSNTIKDQNEVVKPSFIQDYNQTEGSEKKNPNSNEGMVWTDKLVEKVDENGTYRITLYAQGFKYRNVNTDNKREDQWLNPLREDTTLSVTENIPDGFQYVNGSIKVNEDTLIGLNDNEVYDVTDTKNIKLSFDENDVSCSVYVEDGIAFNVEVSFEVKLNTNVVAGTTYKTGEAQSRFVPATDNYYYYTWDIIPTSYGLEGINWSNKAQDLAGVQWINNITIPDIKGNNIVFSINRTGNESIHPIDNDNLKGENTSNYQYEYKRYNITNYLLEYYKDTLDEIGIENVDFLFTFFGIRSNKYAAIRIEINYIDGTTKVFEPLNNVANNAGNEGDKVFFGEVIEKTDPQIRPEFTVEEDENENKVIVDEFENHGEIIFAEITADNLVQDKTASLINWDERTYQIDLYAAHNIQPTDKIANIMLMLDVSGSMPWFVTAPTGGTTSLAKLNNDPSAKSSETITKENDTGTLNEWNYTYYVLRKGEGNSEEYKPIAYTDGEEEVPVATDKNQKIPAGWYYIKSDSNGRKVFQKDDDGPVTVNDTIYIRGENDKTKLEALKIALEYFVENLKVVSPGSKIAYIQFAGEVKTNSNEFISLNDIDIESIINNTKLYGGTNHYAAIKKANSIISEAINDQSNTITKDNTYAILFSDGDLSSGLSDDGQSITNTSVADIATTMKNNYVNLLFGAGIFAELKDGSDNSGVTSLKEWVSKDPVDNSSALVYIGNNSNELINKFSDIFGKITVQISNATVIDYIDSRFVITDEDGNALDVGSKFAGGTIYLKNGQYYIQWDDVNLSYSEDVHKGWHQTIFVKAKEEYIGGNDVLTNGDGSGITVGTIHKEFDKPTVNVKVDFVVGNADETIFLGEAPLGNAQDKLFGKIKNSNGTELTIDPEGNPLDKNDFEFKWYKEVDESKLNVINDTNIADFNIERPTDNTIYYLQVKLKGVDASTDESKTNTNRKDNVDLNTIYAINDIDDQSNKVGEGLHDYRIEDYANKNSKYGVYIVDVVSGSITINKTIDEMTENDTQGDPIFTFHITGTTVSGKTINEYRSVRFESSDKTNNKWVATIDDLEKGKYTITELDTIRYEFNSVTGNDADNYQALISKNDKTVTCFIGYADKSDAANTDTNKRNVEVTYYNKLVNNKDQSDTDIVTNSFTMKDGQIEISANYYKTSSED